MYTTTTWILLRYSYCGVHVYMYIGHVLLQYRSMYNIHSNKVLFDAIATATTATTCFLLLLIHARISSIATTATTTTTAY
jgi:hypothetical protein